MTKTNDDDVMMTTELPFEMPSLRVQGRPSPSEGSAKYLDHSLFDEAPLAGLEGVAAFSTAGVS